MLKCDAHPFRPVIDPASAELDSVTAASYSRAYEEQIWVSYYVTTGSLRSGTRLVNDATRGFIPDYGTDFFAPSTPGPVRILAAVHDNRGGVAWSGMTLLVE